MATTTAKKTTRKTAAKPRSQSTTKPRKTTTTKRAAAPKRTATKKAPTPKTTVSSKPVTVAEAPPEKAGALLRAYRSSLGAIEEATVAVGGTSFEVLSGFGLPEGATSAMKKRHAAAIHAVTHMSDSAATQASKAVSKGLGVITKPFKKRTK